MKRQPRDGVYMYPSDGGLLVLRFYRFEIDDAFYALALTKETEYSMPWQIEKEFFKYAVYIGEFD